MSKVTNKGLPLTLLIFLLLTLLVFPSGSVGAAIGLGISPSTIHIDDALKGNEYQDGIMLYYTGEGETTLQLTATGDIAEWVSFYDPNNLSSPIESANATVGEWTRLWVKFYIPDNAPVGTSTGTILITTAALSESESGASIKLQAKTEVSIVVTGTAVLSGQVNSISARDTEIGYPLRIEVQFKNTGNVVATPEINVNISQDGVNIDSPSFAQEAVKPKQTGTICAEWDTSGRDLGDYTAHVAVALGEENLSTEELSFAILPVGTITRAGVFTELSLKGEPGLGKIIKIQATFLNTGQIDTKAKLIGELYCDNELIDTLESEEALVPVGQSDILTSYVTLEKDGDYDIKGYINYEGKKTEVKEISFSIGGAGGGHSFNWFILAVTVIAILAGVIVYMVLRRKRGKPA